MLSQHQRFFGRSIFALDLAILAISSPAGRLVAGTAPPEGSSRSWFVGVLLVGWLLVSQRLSIYHSRRTEQLRLELMGILEATTLAMGLACIVMLAFAGGVPTAVGPAWLIAVTLILLNRLMVRGLLRLLRIRALNYRQFILVGRGATAHQVAKRIRENPHFGVRIVGELEFEGEELLRPVEGVRSLGTVAAARKILADYSVDEVVICPSKISSTEEIQQVLDLCEGIGAPCRLAPDFLTQRLSRSTVAWLGDVPSYTFVTGPSDPLGLSIKRAMDIAGSALGIILLSPALIGCALAVKLTSKGPVLFRQVRSGLRGRPFVCYKFRSMVIDAEQRRGDLERKNEQEGPVFKMKDDPRITGVGRFLRRYSLDELPQLFNVLVGDMSIVGPRPPIPAEVARYDWWQRRRLSVKPGLTCIWQVSGRNGISFDRWMELDMQYIDRWSLGLDMKIIAKTFGTVIRGTGV
jgi:exopolysaccharide biosynthesis polyprenyl glycosylphosphotransferase